MVPQVDAGLDGSWSLKQCRKVKLVLFYFHRLSINCSSSGHCFMSSLALYIVGCLGARSRESWGRVQLCFSHCAFISVRALCTPSGLLLVLLSVMRNQIQYRMTQAGVCKNLGTSVCLSCIYSASVATIHASDVIFGVGTGLALSTFQFNGVLLWGFHITIRVSYNTILK